MEPGNPHRQWTPNPDPSYPTGENRGFGRPAEQSWGAAPGAYGAPQGFGPAAPNAPAPYGGAAA
ncbi:MAG: hypothetical protein JWP39_3924, partial [Jatrophihabitans sp.]|nr:hypothetical protein [Jatrophihabitans sp.]